MTKSEKELSKLLNEINKRAGELTNVEVIDLLSAALDKHREVSIQEAYYRALSLPMTMSSIKVKFLNTAHPHFRDGLLKNNLEELDSEESLFHLSPHNYYEHRALEVQEGFESRYTEEEKREDYWRNLSLAEFWSRYEVVYNNDRHEHLSSTLIPLRNNVGFIRRRKEECVIRYHLNHHNDEDYKRGSLILFFPFTDEVMDIHEQDVDSLYSENKDVIDEKRSKFEKNKNLTEIIESIEKQSKENDENEEEGEGEDFVDEETTSPTELEDFEKWAKNEAKKCLAKVKDFISVGKIEDIRDSIISLNPQQRRILDDFCERMADSDEVPFHLFIAGEAGTGKSYLMRVMIEAAKYLKLESGSDLNKPTVLVMAPTANAAYIINGKTIESALGMLPTRQNTYSKRNRSCISNLAFLLEKLKLLVIDEISMVGSCKFTRMDFTLQDIYGNSEFLGGLAMLVGGDFHQLPPVRDLYIYLKNNLDGRPSICKSPWNEHFRIYYLTDKMRNQKDPEFAALCDRVGSGKYTSEDLEYLRLCVRETDSENSNRNFKDGKISIIVLTNKVRQKYNNMKLDTLLKENQTYICDAIDRCTNLENPPTLPTDLPLTKTGQLETNLMLKEDAPIVITSNHLKAKYKEDGIVNGAKGYVDSVQVSKKNPDFVEVVWVVFNDKNIGGLLRFDLRDLKKLHRPYDDKAVPILRQKKTFKVNNGEVCWQRNQFPLTLAYALTSYKCQGDTLQEVIVDFSDEAKEMKSVTTGSFYVAISRVKEGRHVYLKNFEEKYITTDKKVEEMMELMKEQRPYEFKKTYVSDQIFVDEDNEVKLGYLNINGFCQSNHAQYFDADINLQGLDYLVLSETWLSQEQNNNEVSKFLKNWTIKKRYDSTDNRKHMGLLLLIPTTKEENYQNQVYDIKYIEGYSNNSSVLLYQGIVLEMIPFYQRIAFLYMRKTPSMTETKQLMKETENCHVIIGDLNLNPAKEDQKNMLSILCGENRIMSLNESTYLNQSQLDHIIVDKSIAHVSFSTSYLNLATDHRSVVLRLGSIDNKFTREFQQKKTFDKDSHLKKKKLNNNMNIEIESHEKEQLAEKRKLSDTPFVPQKKKKIFENTNQVKRKRGDDDQINFNLTNDLKVLLFENPPRENLCFSNVTTTLILNLPGVTNLMSTLRESRLKSVKYKLLKELLSLCQKDQFSKCSTNKLRALVTEECNQKYQDPQQFDDKRQHDAADFLASFLEHFTELTDELKENFGESLFGGLQEQIFKCKRCNKESRSNIEEMANILPIDLISESLQECLNKNFHDTEEDHPRVCDFCKNNHSERILNLINEPKVLILQLKRFLWFGNGAKKQTPVSAPTVITLPSGTAYVLNSIVNHIGNTLAGGHYTISLHNKEAGNILILDDSKMYTKVLDEEEKSSMPYMFVYVQM